MNEQKNELLAADLDGGASFADAVPYPPGVTAALIEAFIAALLSEEEAEEFAENLSADPFLYARVLAARDAYRELVPRVAPARTSPENAKSRPSDAKCAPNREAARGRSAGVVIHSADAKREGPWGSSCLWAMKGEEPEGSPPEVITLATINEDLRAFTGGHEDFVRSLMHPNRRAWFRACHALVHGESDEGFSAEVWSAIEEQLEAEAVEMARLHVSLARVLREHARSLDAAAPAIDALAAGFSGPKGFILDLAQELLTDPRALEGIIRKAGNSGAWHGDLRPAEREGKIAGIVVEESGSDNDAFVVFLEMEVVVDAQLENGALRLYPAPAMALWTRDEHFREAEKTAETYAGKLVPGGRAVEVRWRLARGVARPLAARLCGPSLGLAFGFLLRRLFAGPNDPIARVSIATVAFSGRLEADGKVRPVGGFKFKKDAQGVDTIMMPDEDIRDANARKELENHDPGDGKAPVLTVRNGAVRILPVTDVDSAAELLAVDCEGRWQGIGCDLPAIQPDYEGRTRLTAEILRFIDETESGYGLVIGSMGSGKTSFMNRLLHRLVDEGHHPAFEFVPPPPTVLRRAENVARRLYQRLRRTYVTAEPAAWEDWDIKRKIEELLNFLSERNVGTGRKVVLVLDAADEVELPAGEALVPGFLPAKLPPGVVCIISSTRALAWLRDNGLVKEWFGMRDKLFGVPLCTDDSADVRMYLRKQKTYPLPPKFIDRIIDPTNPPVFFTVVKRLSEIASRPELLERPELWNKLPEELIQRRISRILHDVDPQEQKQREVWDTLGILSLVREPVCEVTLDRLGLWQQGFTNLILREAGSFFTHSTAIRPAHQQLFSFSHPGYPRVIEKALGDSGMERCHRLLAEHCQPWSKLTGLARNYALRHAPSHQRRARMWAEHYELLTDFAYLEERMTRLPCAQSEEGDPASSANEPPQLSVSRVVRNFELAVEKGHGFPANHPGRRAIEALRRVIERASHLFQDRPQLLVQHIYNELLRDLGDFPDLAQKLDLAIKNSERIVLKRLNLPEAPPEGIRQRVLKGHRKPVNAVALSPNEEIVASASADETVMLWRVGSAELVHVLRGHGSEVRSVTWSRDGRLIASAGDTVRLWDPDAGNCVGELPVNKGAAVVAFSPSEDILAVAGRDGSLRLYDPERKDWIATLRGGGPRIRCLKFSGDGRLLVVGGADMIEGKGAADLYETATRSHLRTLPKLANWVDAIELTPDNKMVAIGLGVEPGEVKFFDVESGSFQRNIPVHRSGVRALAISQNGILVTGSFDYTLGLRDLATSAVLRTDMGHGNAILSVAISRDGNLVVSAGADHLVNVWHITPAPAQPLPDGDAAKAARAAHLDIIHAIRFSPDGRLVTTASKDRSALIFLADRSEAFRAFCANGETVNVAVISPDGKLLAIGSKGIVKIFDFASGRELHCLVSHGSWVLDIAWTPDSAFLVSASEDNTAMVWDARTGAWLRTLKAHTARLRAVAISPNGEYVATAGDDTKVCVWELATGQLLHTLHGHTLRVKALAWSREGWLASGGSDAFIKLWDPLTGRDCGKLDTSAQEIWTLQFAPSRFLAAGSNDGMALLFDLNKGEEVACLACSDAVQAIWFNADGTEVRFATRGGPRRVPDIYVTQIVSRARQ